MLWGIDPLLDADLLYALRRMGHGDEIAIVDANFPAASTASQTITGQPIVMNGVSAARAVEAVLSIMPLDTFVPDPALRMEVTGDPVGVPPVQQEVQAAIDKAVGPASAAGRHRALRLLRPRRGSLRHPGHRRAPSLRLLPVQEGRAAGGIARALTGRRSPAHARACPPQRPRLSRFTTTASRAATPGASLL